MSKFTETEFYDIHEPTFMCCDQSQFTYYNFADLIRMKNATTGTNLGT